MADRIIAVIVTYNRIGLLRQCLAAVLAQTRAVAEIVVVNNASSDETREVLEGEYATLVNRIHMAHNVGGAGGFYRGMSWAYDNGADWLWLMDDDGVPSPDCLERLLDLQDGCELDVRNPLVLRIDDPNRTSFGYLLGGSMQFEAAEIRTFSQRGIILDAIAPFNGTLISRRAYEKAGPIKREMFIWGDEEEYGLRLKQLGISHGTVCDAVHLHPQQRGAVEKFGILGTFSIPLIERAGIYHRNFAFVSAKRRGVHYIFAKSLAYFAYFTFTGRYNRFGVYLRYTIDGVRDRYVRHPSRADLFKMGDEFREVRRA